MNTRAKYFVLYLDKRDFRPFPEAKFEIQLLDADGQAKRSVYLRDGDINAEIDGELIPETVINAAWKQLPGSGDYVDEAGNAVQPF